MSGGPRDPVLRLADEFFLLAHDQEGTRMRPRLLPTVLGLGTASALVAELMLAGLVGELDGYLMAARRVRSARAPDGEPHEVMTRVVELIGSGSRQSVQQWLGELRHFAAEGVRDRLLDSGVLTEARVRRWWGGSGVDVQAVDQNLALAPEVRLYSLFGDHHGRPEADLRMAVLAGLADATGLIGKIRLWDTSAAAARNRAASVRADLPEPLSGLLAHTEIVVGVATLSSRHH
jgi:Golgi phosphoprotein 3 GPP34